MVNESVWPPNPAAMYERFAQKVCPKCGFKTGYWINKIGLTEAALKED
ncbi:MAG: hypothetical protein ACI9GW_001987 [Halieaceae bacterium]|jgi:hypothetical protein